MADFALEITAVGGKLESEDDLSKALPQLGKFINKVAKRLSISGFQVLVRLGAVVQEMLEEGGAVSYRLQKLLKLQLKIRQEEVYGPSAEVGLKRREMRI